MLKSPFDADIEAEAQLDQLDDDGCVQTRMCACVRLHDMHVPVHMCVSVCLRALAHVQRNSRGAQGDGQIRTHENARSGDPPTTVIRAVSLKDL